jgi:MFS family permease
MEVAQKSKSKLSTVVGSSLIGTTIEFYDFFIYGTAAALVFPRVSFPTLSPYAGIMAAYATLAIPFLTRPLGAIVFGHFGDRFGRKVMLVAALTIMGLTTFAIGLVRTMTASACGHQPSSSSCACCRVSRSAANGAERRR